MNDSTTIAPPLEISNIRSLSAKPRPVAESLFTAGSGLILEGRDGPVSIIINQANGSLVLPYDDAKRFFDLEISDTSRSIEDVMAILGVKPSADTDRGGALQLGKGILSSARWTAAPDDDLSHDEETGVTYLMNALADPEGFLAKHVNTSSPQQEDEIKADVPSTPADEATTIGTDALEIVSQEL